MEPAAENEHSIACPRCRGEDFHRSRGRGLFEKIVLRAFGRTLYRCNQCGVRFYTKRGEQARS
jgi:DNA-directed RNA polymerase subunit RPC12/RpoP